jgi:hydroxymethylbilane synthase
MTEIHRYRLGTRKSALAQVQSESIRRRLEESGLFCELVGVESSGDQNRHTPLYEIESETPGLFTKQLEVALLADQIDLAVHSLKDLPTQQPEGLRVAAVTARASAGDCLVIDSTRFRPGDPLGLPQGATVGTSSLRREALLLSQRPDLKIVPIRGNVPTRVQSVRDHKVDAVVLAQAGLQRLGLPLDEVTKRDLPPDRFISAPGQGALAIETRSRIPRDLEGALTVLRDPVTERETRVERRILRELEGGCTLPLGVRCLVDSTKLTVRAFLGVQRDRNSAPHDWISFHHFDRTEAETEEEALIAKTVAYFKEVLNGR